MVSPYMSEMGYDDDDYQQWYRWLPCFNAPVCVCLLKYMRQNMILILVRNNLHFTMEKLVFMSASFHLLLYIGMLKSYLLFNLTLLRSKILFSSRSNAVEHLRICVIVDNCSFVRESSYIRMSNRPITAAMGVLNSWL